MTAARTVRYPLEPLLELLDGTMTERLERLGISGTTAKEYRTLGVSELVADRLACRVGLDPYQVWPEILDRAVAEIEARDRAAAEAEAAGLRCCAGCGTGFDPEDDRQRYCTRRCAKAAAQRRRKARIRFGAGELVLAGAR